MPGLVEADDDGMYVLKFRGAGQGPKALIAEILAAQIGLALGLPIPEPVLVDLVPALGKAEPDPEIHDLLLSSAGINAGLDFLPGSLPFSPESSGNLSAELASKIVWFDAFMMNMDRTVKNPNMLIWHDKLWLIDHGAALYVHHAPGDFVQRSESPFPQIHDHVLLDVATELEMVSGTCAAMLNEQLFAAMVDQIPASWIEEDELHVSGMRNDYVEFLSRRLEGRDVFVEEALRGRA